MSHRYLDTVNKVAEARAHAQKAQKAQKAPLFTLNTLNTHTQRPARERPYEATLAALEARCPEYVPVDRWQQAVADAGVFLAHWGEQAEQLRLDAPRTFRTAPRP
jgi:hypothetical protein